MENGCMDSFHEARRAYSHCALITLSALLLIQGLGLLLSWALAELTRSAAQAKLLGDQIGLNPLASLLSVYVGWRVAGVGGMLLFPLGLMVLIRLNDRGVVRLWRNI